MTRTSALVDRIGPAHAETLARLVGGTRLHVPGQIRNIGRLRKVVGEDLAVLLVFHFGDSRIYVPRPTTSPPVDVRTVARLTNRGASARTIAKRLGCCDRTVHAKRALARERGLIKPQA